MTITTALQCPKQPLDQWPLNSHWTKSSGVMRASTLALPKRWDHQMIPPNKTSSWRSLVRTRDFDHSTQRPTRILWLVLNKLNSEKLKLSCTALAVAETLKKLTRFIFCVHNAQLFVLRDITVKVLLYYNSAYSSRNAPVVHKGSCLDAFTCFCMQRSGVHTIWTEEVILPLQHYYSPAGLTLTWHFS